MPWVESEFAITRKLINLPRVPTKSMHKLNFIVNQWSHLPVQGSQEWLESRRTRIGGSEIASAIGLSPYQKREELVAAKLVPKRFKSAACSFGRAFEPVAKQFIEETDGLDIRELGAVPSTRYPMCYSPDGIFAVGEELVLLEIKCPFRRSDLRRVPEHYKCQVKAGMCILPCEETYFYQFRFRACSLAQLGGGKKYNRWLHVESYKRAPEASPIRWGYIHYDDDTDLIDLGCLNRDNESQLCVIERLDGVCHWERKELPDSGYILPWKLFDVAMEKIPRDPAFLDDHSQVLWEIHKKLAA